MSVKHEKVVHFAGGAVLGDWLIVFKEEMLMIEMGKKRLYSKPETEVVDFGAKPEMRILTSTCINVYSCPNVYDATTSDGPDFNLTAD